MFIVHQFLNKSNPNDLTSTRLLFQLWARINIHVPKKNSFTYQQGAGTWSPRSRSGEVWESPPCSGHTVDWLAESVQTQHQPPICIHNCLLSSCLLDYPEDEEIIPSNTVLVLIEAHPTTLLSPEFLVGFHISSHPSKKAFRKPFNMQHLGGFWSDFQKTYLFLILQGIKLMHRVHVSHQASIIQYIAHVHNRGCANH